MGPAGLSRRHAQGRGGGGAGVGRGKSVGAPFGWVSGVSQPARGFLHALLGMFVRLRVAHGWAGSSAVRLRREGQGFLSRFDI